MGDGESDANESAGHRPLPPEDRVWRHPAEVAMEARQIAARVRRQRIRASGTLVGGVLAVSALVWLGQNGGTDVSLSDKVASVGQNDADQSSTSLRAVASLDSTIDSYVVIWSAESAEMLAGAVIGPDGFLITSGSALDGADEVLITWGDQQQTGRVVGHDAVTDVTVIQLTNALHGSDPADDSTQIAEGDLITLADLTGNGTRQKVVSAESTSANDDGSPMVGVVELDGRIGHVPPGSPAYNSAGDIVGMTTSTARSAPAALVPIGLVRGVANELIDHGSASHPWLGVTARNSDDPGSFVTAVAVDGPAELGGIHAGDLIVEIGSKSIESMESMVATLRQFEPGDATTVVVERDGQRIDCSVELSLKIDAA